MSPKAFVALLAAVALLQVAAAQGGPVVEWLKNNKETTTAGALLGQLYPKPISDKARFTILAPTNEAIEAFRRDMGLTPAQFKDRTGLLDIVVAYHIIPGYQAKELKVVKSPAAAVTGDINYVLRFHNTDKGVDVEDVQGNRFALRKPVVLGNAAIIVIDKVLMSGSYFFDGKKALTYYPQWSKAEEFASAVGYPEGTGREQDLSFFVPDNKAMEAASGALAKLSNDDKKNLFLYHVSPPARYVPSDFKKGQMPTNFKGHDITVDVSTDTKKMDAMTGQANAVPDLVITSETGNKANTKIYNVYVGKSIWQGIDAVLIPKFGGGVTTEAGKKSGGNRKLLVRGGGYSSQTYANTVSQDNTARAIEAAATGKIPTSYATRYGSYSAKNVATYGDCLNCSTWN
jgi:uncharacterized surface protein with fasciclin (FAS1) repeats